jgi:dTMP kinase
LGTREPGGAPGAERLRALLLSPKQDWSPAAEVLLHFAARAEHVAHTIAPALAAGAWVVCDRFSDSTMAYQGYGQGADRAMIATLAGLIGLRPDLTIVFDIDPAIGRARMLARDAAADRYERLGAAFHSRVAAGFRAIAAAEPARCVVIDASASEQDVARQVTAAVAHRFALPMEAR